jgi:hypothetical protein
MMLAEEEAEKINLFLYFDDNLKTTWCKRSHSRGRIDASQSRLLCLLPLVKVSSLGTLSNWYALY